MKEIRFPILSGEQVALIRAERNTGIVLDENLERHISGVQVMYSVFDNYEKALDYINNVSRKDIEFVIYGKNEEALFLYP